MLAKCVLASPATGHRLRWREILHLVKSRLKRWDDGDLTSLWREAVEGSQALSRRRGTLNQHKHNIKRTTHAAQNGQYSKAMKALTSDGLASANDKIFMEMLNKHPQSPASTLPPGEVPPSIKLTESTILKGVKSFPPGSAPGPSGLHPSHLREAALCPSPDRASRLLFSLTSFVNYLASGQSPLIVIPHLCGATLLASQKKNGGLRPIAVGEVFRRLTSKCLAFCARSVALPRLLPNQLGVGVKGGCEAIIHAVSTHLSSSSTDHRWTLLLDFSNAFNSIDREAMFHEFRKHIPSLSSWIEACYSSQPNLLMGKYSLHSCCGVQQGDPLGPLGFAVTLQPIIERIEAEVPNLDLNAWDLDDGTLIGSPEDLLAALKVIERDGPGIGLHLNKAKSLLYIPDEADPSTSPLPSEIPVSRYGFSLLGCPIGPAEFCEAIFQQRVNKIKLSLNGLSELEDSQVQTTLLRSCLALPKVAFVLRACPPGFIRNAASDFDSAIRRTLESILGGPLSDWSWQKASLPCRMGGLGLRSALLHSPAAFLDSTLRSKRMVQDLLGDSLIIPTLIDDSVSAIAIAAARPDWQNLDDFDVALHQRALSASIDEASYQHLIASAPTTRSRALALSTSLPHAYDWLNVVPSPSLGLHLQDREFRFCLSYWLGVPLHNSQFTCPECRGVADPYGDHQIGCGGNNDRIGRHNAIRDVIFSAAQSAALAPSREASNMVPDSATRPADVLLPNWQNGRPAALDIHVISPLQPLTLTEAAELLLNSNLSNCRYAGVECIPMVAETLGGLASDFISTVRAIGRSVGLRSSLGDTTKHLFGRVSIALWRGNASMWLHRQPTLPPELDGQP